MEVQVFMIKVLKRKYRISFENKSNSNNGIGFCFRTYKFLILFYKLKGYLIGSLPH